MELIAQFTSSVKSGVSPLTVNFVNTSTGPFTSVQWNFGDGETSTEINPTHQYTTEGTFEVTLTIFDSQGNTNSTTGIIIVFPESSVEDESVQRGLYVAKRFNSGEVQVKVETVSGSTFESLYPFSSETKVSYGQKGIYELGIIGSESFYSDPDTAYYSAGTLDYDDFHTYISGNGGTDGFEGYVAIAFGGPSGNTSLDRWEDIFSGGSIPKPVQIFKVKSIDTGSTPTISGGPLTLERRAPSYVRNTIDPNGLLNALLIVTKTGNTTTSTYTSNSYKFLSTNLGVDSYDDFYITGLTNVDNSYGGTVEYFGLDENSGQTLAVTSIDYSGYSSAEKFKPGTIFYSLPWIMWHKNDGSESGIKLYDSYGDVQYDENTGQRFKYLRDGISQSDNVVGKVFYDKKVVTITDRELSSVLNFTSNRNWTLPEPRITIDGDGGTNLSGIKYYITYKTQDFFQGRAGTGQAYGFYSAQEQHCNYIQTITPTISGQTLRIKAEDSPWRSNDLNTGTGFSQQQIWLIMGTGSTTSTHPVADSLYYSATTHESLSGGVSLPDYSDFVTANNPYSGWWGSDSDASPDNEDMPFGSHGLGLGYLSGTFESTIYKMAATCVAKNNEFNATQNSSFNDERSNDNVYITEVALYNENNELLMIGKLNKPIKKNDERYLTVRMEVDL